MINQEIAKIFKEISILFAMQEVAFKPQAFERAATNIENLGEDLKDIYKRGGTKALEEIQGVGKSMSEMIEEYIKTKKIKEHLALKKKIPVDIEGLTSVEGVGPKGVYKLYKKLGIRTLGDLEKAAKAGLIKSLEGFGEKSEEKILKGLEFVKKHIYRYVLGFVLPEIREIISRLEKSQYTEKVLLCGSARRMQETVGDIDILITSKKPKEVMDLFIKMPEVGRVVAKGETKSVVKLRNGLEMDLRVVVPESFGAAAQYFTGDKNHNVELRKIAIDKGYKLNEYGLFKVAERRGSKRGFTRKEVMIAGKTEEEIYNKLGLDYIEPELRTLSGEIEAAQNHILPKLIGYNDLKGDLQIQTTWTDGENTIEEMAEAAMKMGLEYILITDHTKSLAMTGGSDEKKLEKQMSAIDEINYKLKAKSRKLRVLKGAEVNILKDGSLDIDDKTLAKLDIVGVAVHSLFNLPKAEQTKRIIKAMENPNVDILFHPTGRIINKRPAYEVDMVEIVKAAKRTGTVLEIDAFADRLDLKDEHIRMALAEGVKLSIDSDAHHTDHFKYLELGIAQARRAWTTKSDIVNAWPLEKMLGFLKK
ncbi:MAG: DNA polymerase/3'-5' exonuclease PolX [bacterium]|nr:DNA polymerase/3'-5' exonuclease PolX [bacterium]